MADETPYSFPPAPTPDASEWPGSPIGVSNTITRTKGRTAVHNKTVDQTPGLLEKLLKSAHDHLGRISSQQEIFEHDVAIHGIRVRATTNSRHLFDFWKDNWFGVDEWAGLVGTPPAEPRIKVYALLGVEGEQEAAYYSHATDTIVFFNTSYYGQLKSWVLGAVGRILASEFGIHSIHGACVEKAGKGVLYIAPTGTGKSTSSYGLMTYPKTRFHSDDWVYVRYTYRTRGGGRVFLLSAAGSDGSKARGYEVYRWVEAHPGDGRACLTAMTLDNRPLELALADLDLTQPIEAYAYISEKLFYLRTNLVENYPLAAFEIASSKEENVPDVSARFMEQKHEVIQNVVRDLAEAVIQRAFSPGAARNPHSPVFQNLSTSELKRAMARLIAFDNARSMLDMSRVLPPERCYTNPMEPVKLAAVMLLRRNKQDPTVLAHLPLESFMERLLIGETPDGKRETAYNAYRTVDDQAERALIDGLEKQASPTRPLYTLFSAASRPASLDEEFELFRVMHQAALCYDLNTTLERDPAVESKREAVERTMAVIARTLDEEPSGVSLSLQDYGRYAQPYLLGAGC